MYAQSCWPSVNREIVEGLVELLKKKGLPVSMIEEQLRRYKVFDIYIVSAEDRGQVPYLTTLGSTC